MTFLPLSPPTTIGECDALLEHLKPMIPAHFTFNAPGGPVDVELRQRRLEWVYFGSGPDRKRERTMTVELTWQGGTQRFAGDKPGRDWSHPVAERWLGPKHGFARSGLWTGTWTLRLRKAIEQGTDVTTPSSLLTAGLRLLADQVS